VIEDLRKNFKDVKVLEGIDLKVERGTVLALLGPNGAGKTTTIRILSTLLQPDDGRAYINGHDVVKDPDAVRASIGLTGQYAAVDELLTGRENLEMMGRLYHLSKADSRTRAEEMLAEFELTDAANRAVKTYSGGMKRRLDVAASLIAAPPILFLDEPTTGLDPRSRLKVWDIVQQLVDAGATIFLTTQYLDEADKLADRIAVLDHGRIIAEGTADELKEKVGKDRLEVTVTKESDFDAALRAVEGAAAQSDPEERRVSVAMEGGVHEVKELLDRLERAGVKIEGLALHKPTLDDVFLHLTGHEAMENDQVTKK
jgi:ABC-2 type transport system ATP-binding protein